MRGKDRHESRVKQERTCSTHLAPRSVHPNHSLLIQLLVLAVTSVFRAYDDKRTIFFVVDSPQAVCSHVTAREAMLVAVRRLPGGRVGRAREKARSERSGIDVTVSEGQSELATVIRRGKGLSVHVSIDVVESGKDTVRRH